MNPDENNIMLNPAPGYKGTGEIGWQAIGYYKGAHVSAFGTSPVDALTKALPTEEEIDVWA